MSNAAEAFELKTQPENSRCLTDILHEALRAAAENMGMPPALRAQKIDQIATRSAMPLAEVEMRSPASLKRVMK
ncbi:hypothetical protein ACC771_17450, partial [Rhizobium ruizarguesonis]